MTDKQAERIRRFEQWYPKAGQQITSQALGEIQRNQAMREELARRLRESGFKDANGQNAVSTLVSALKANNLAFQGQGDTIAAKAAYYRRQGVLMTMAAVVANHSRKGSITQFTEGWAKLELGAVPMGSTGNRVADKVVEMVRGKLGPLQDKEALSEAIGFAQFGLMNARISSDREMGKTNNMAAIDISTVAGLKTYNKAFSGYMDELAKKNAFERLNNVMVDAYVRVGGNPDNYSKIDVGDLDKAAQARAKFTGSLSRAYLEMGKGKPGGTDPYEFAAMMLHGGVPEAKLATFLGQKIDKNMVPGIVADARSMVTQAVADQTKRRTAFAEKWALATAGNGQEPKPSLKQQAEAPKIAPKAPRLAVNENTPPKPNKVAEQPQEAPKPQSTSFFERLKDQAKRKVEDMLVRAGLKKESPKPVHQPVYGQALRNALPKVPKKDTYLGPDAVPDKDDLAYFEKIESICKSMDEIKVGKQPGQKRAAPEKKLEIDDPKLALGMGRM